MEAAKFIETQTIAFTPPTPRQISCSHASEKRGSGADGGVGGVGGWVVGGLDPAYLRTLSAAVAAAEFLTVAISRTPK